MKPLVVLLSCLLVSGCAAPARTPSANQPAAAAPDKPVAIQAPAPAPAQPSQPTALASASALGPLAVGYRAQGEDGVLTVPPVTTVVAVAPDGAVVDFYASGEKGVRQLGQSRPNEAQHYSLTFTVPADLGPVLTVWATLDRPDAPSPVLPPDTGSVMKIRPAAVASGTPAELDGFPLFPAFTWHTELTDQERRELTEWQGEGWEQGADLIAYSGRLFDLSGADVLAWSLSRGEEAGWTGLGPAGGGTQWGMVGTRNGVKVRVNFGLGSGCCPPLRPELGYGMLVRVYK